MKSLVALSFLFSSALAAPPTWITYSNARFGYSVQRPANMTPGPEPENGDGMKFTGDGITLTVYGSNRIEEPYAKFKSEWLSYAKEGKVTYHRIKDAFYVISGHKGSEHFYQRTIWNKDSYASILIEYPAVLDKEEGATMEEQARTLKFKSMLGHITKSLKFN